MVSVIIPAHNESAVIGRSLRALLGGAWGEGPAVEVIVVCNGCTDDTAERARAVGGPVRVIETDVASKTHALNLGDRAARGYPRVYVDADVVLPADSLRRIVEHLEAEKTPAAAPGVRLDLSRSSWAVRAFYDIDRRLPTQNDAIGGSGVYGVSRKGREKFTVFPDVTADDAFVRRHFAPAERVVVEGAWSTVTPPTTLRGVIAIKTRSHFGNYEIATLHPELSHNRGRGNGRVLLHLSLRPTLWPRLFIYSMVKLAAKARAYRRFRTSREVGWERDETSRSGLSATSKPSCDEQVAI